MLLEILEAKAPVLCATRDDLRSHLRSGFPWHTPEIPHPHIRDAKAWWHTLIPVFERAYSELGLSAERASELAAQVPTQFCRPDKWQLFEDTVQALTALSEKGWSHVILSNHVPELPDIVSSLGLASFFAGIHTSAVTGYEKPHPDVFRVALRTIPDLSRVWMVGDNPIADIAPAEKLGIPAVLVRRSDENVRRQCNRLMEAMEMIESSWQDA